MEGLLESEADIGGLENVLLRTERGSGSALSE
jgi:hypothetical protein